MKTLLTIALALWALSAKTQTFSWVKQLGGAGNDVVYSIVTDAGGNIYTTGKLEGTVDFDPGAGVFNLTASGSTDVFVCKSDASGNLIWAKQFGSDYTLPGEEGKGIAVSASGSIYVTGTFRDTADMDPGPGVFNLITTVVCPSHPHTDIFILKLTAEGDFVWAGQVGGKGYDHAIGITLGIDDAMLITGDYTMINLVGETRVVDMDPGPGEYLVSNIYGVGAAFVLKLDSSGTFQWVDSFHSTGGSVVGCTGMDGNVRSHAIAVDGSGNIYSTGIFGSSTDFDPGAGTNTLTPSGGMNAYVLKLNNTGGLVWARHFTGGSCYGYDVAVDGSGNVYTTGQFANTVDFNPGTGANKIKAPGSPGTPNIYVSKLNASGNYVWAMQLGGNSADYAYSIDMDASGNVYTTGNFTGTADFNPSSAKYNLTSAGAGDVFVSKLTSAGAFAWAVRLGGTADERAYCIEVTPSGNVLSTGTFNGTADFNPGSGTFNLTSTGVADAYIHMMGAGSPRIGALHEQGFASEVKLYPNPVHEALNIVAHESIEEIIIMDARGRLVKQIPFAEQNGGTVSIDVSALEAGIYSVRVMHSGKVTINKVVVIK